MKINSEGLALLKKFEGCKLKAYKDGGGVLTIGYGHTKAVKSSDTLTQAEADKLLSQDLKWAEDAIKNLVAAPLNDNQFSALVSLVFNIGETAFTKSTIRKLLNAELYHESARQFLKFVYDNRVFVQGLYNRRVAEKALFEKA